MNLRDLAWPLRIYWDLPESSSDSGLCMKVCDDIVEIKILFLSLRDAAPMAGQGCVEILDRLKGRNIGLLTVRSAVASTDNEGHASEDAACRSVVAMTSGFDRGTEGRRMPPSVFL
jgi:hypothetical protein